MSAFTTVLTRGFDCYGVSGMSYGNTRISAPFCDRNCCQKNGTTDSRFSFRCSCGFCLLSMNNINSIRNHKLWPRTYPELRIVCLGEETTNALVQGKDYVMDFTLEQIYSIGISPDKLSITGNIYLHHTHEVQKRRRSIGGQLYYSVLNRDVEVFAEDVITMIDDNLFSSGMHMCMRTFIVENENWKLRSDTQQARPTLMTFTSLIELNVHTECAPSTLGYCPSCNAEDLESTRNSNENNNNNLDIPPSGIVDAVQAVVVPIVDDIVVSNASEIPLVTPILSDAQVVPTVPGAPARNRNCSKQRIPKDRLPEYLRRRLFGPTTRSGHDHTADLICAPVLNVSAD